MAFFNRRTPQDDDEFQDLQPEDTEELTSEATEPTTPDTKDEALPASRMFDTALGAGSQIEGTFSSDGNVRLDGQFKGTLNIKENVLIGLTAEIEADVEAKNVSIAGLVRGNVTGKKVHLLASAQVWGDIFAETLITENGAFIEGRVSMSGAKGDLPKLPEVNTTDNERGETNHD